MIKEGSEHITGILSGPECSTLSWVGVESQAERGFVRGDWVESTASTINGGQTLSVP